MNHPRFLLLVSIGLFVLECRVTQAEESPLLGFGRDETRQQRMLEDRFDALLKKDNLKEWMKRMTLRPHHIGSPYGKDNAEFIGARFRSWGFETAIEEFQVLFPTPKIRILETVKPERFTARLVEPELKEDATSGHTAEQLPSYNAYSADGEVTSEVVYVNYGVPKDYEALAEKGIDVKGKIVIARYGESWRGIKPKVAAEHGAVGCIIYSDPRDDGYFQGDVYPKGAWRSEDGAQRGSVADISLYSGDPLTPSLGATQDAKRLPVKEAPTLTKVPVLPISYADALPILRGLGGPMAPEEWRGALPISYHLGPGPTTVHLKLEFDWKLVTAYDVIARLQGTERPDQWIIRGNHHDAWVFGAWDPVSGTVALMEEARVVGELSKGGWKPKRTIVYAAWDGEEPGLLGSTEWVETHAELLDRNAAVYINSDSNSRGFLGIGGSHTLERFIDEIARDVRDPEKKIPVSERARAVKLVKGTPEERKLARERAGLEIEALGSGSDYTPFLQHLGVASLNLGYGGEDGAGSYHSIYDSFDHYTKFGDANFDYGVTLAQTAGRATLRLANAGILPFEFTHFSRVAEKYLREVTKLLENMREETVQKNQLISDRTLEAVADSKETFVAPKLESPVPYLNFAALQNSLDRLKESAQTYETSMNALFSASQGLRPEAEKSLDGILMKTERALTRSEGLPRRPWFRHQVYAPGAYTGYGVKTLPGVREAIERRDWKEANDQVQILAKTLERFTDEIDRATQTVKSSTQR
jgi:N-acetylated-alpha-linked acidic dipeptidase